MLVRMLRENKLEVKLFLCVPTTVPGGAPPPRGAQGTLGEGGQVILLFFLTRASTQNVSLGARKGGGGWGRGVWSIQRLIDKRSIFQS